jgi:hypothetical protein
MLPFFKISLILFISALVSANQEPPLSGTFAAVSLPLSQNLPLANSWIPSSLVPESSAFLGWKKSPSLEDSESPWALERVQLNNCQDQNLYPTHPSMSLKKYHFVYVGKFDVTQLQRSSPACKIASTMATNLKCVIADELYHFIVSDTYQDRCGNFYRAFSRKIFFKRQEKMETLFSPGRSMMKTPGSFISGDYTTQGTQPVPRNEFLFLTSLFSQDLSKIETERSRTQASGEFDLDSSSLIFRRR